MVITYVNEWAVKGWGVNNKKREREMTNKQIIKTEKINTWDSITKWILGIAIFFIVFSFIAPALFVSNSLNTHLDFTQTGPIGDTIGGIMNPFIALVGVLFTFLAFYMQIKANQIQQQLFLDGLMAEKQKTEDLEKKDAEYKISLLKTDLENIIKDIDDKAGRIKEFYEAERKNPYVMNLLFRTPSKKYTRILDLDRLSIYKGFKLFFSTDNTWLNTFNRLYSVLDYLPLFFDEIYNIYDNHSKTKYEKKNEVNDLLLEFNNRGSQLLTTYKIDNGNETYLNFPASSLVNNTIDSYYKIVNGNYNEEGNIKKEIDYTVFSDKMLFPFIQEALDQRENPALFDRRLEPLIQLASDIRKKIHLIKQEGIWFANNVEEQYKILIVDKEDSKSTKTVIKEILEFISKDLVP
ncbi:MAG: hypothetical protein MK202_14170 [Tenacibaculum sp.]|nr:hypothetical protein [Tenacibaculum sp.]